MNNMHIISRSQHPHLKGTQQEIKQNKTRIELTHTQTYIANQQKSYHSTISSPYIPRNQQKQLSEQKERSYHSIQSKISSSGQTNFLLLMKEQIDIATSNYQEKMGKILKAQAQEILRLSNIITHGNRVIQRQSEVLKSIRNNEEMFMSSKTSRAFIPEQLRSTSKSPSKISLTQRKSARKMTNPKELSPLKGQLKQNDDIQSRMSRLTYAIEQIQKRLKINSNQNKELLYKVYQLEQKMTSEIWRKMKNCEESVKKFLNQNQKKVFEIQKITDSLSSSKKEIQNRLNAFSEQSKELRQLLYNISQRQFTYQSYQIVRLKQQLQRISEQVDLMKLKQKNEMSVSSFKKQQSFNHQSSQKAASRQNHSLNYSQHIAPKNNMSIANQQLQRSQLSSLSHYAPKYVKNMEEDRVKRSEEWDQLQQNKSVLSDDDEFYYDDIDTQTQIREQRLISLQNILKKQGYKFPVRIQIDETGYLKQYATGMYILDELDNGFELTQDEVKQLKMRGIVN